MNQNQNLLEEERLERPFDPNRGCSISIWTTEGVKMKLRERGAKVGKSLSGYTKELVESAANGFASEPGAEMYEAELERQAVENNALRTENNELKEKIAAKDKLILQLNNERRTAPKTEADKPESEADKQESGADMLRERLCFAVAVAETLNAPVADAYIKLLSLCGLSAEYAQWKGVRK